MKAALPSILLIGVRAASVHVAVAAEAAPPIHHPQINYSNDAAAAHIADDIMGQHLSTKVALPRSYPECWTASVATLSGWDVGAERRAHSSGASYCASLSSEEKDVLALELTHCKFTKENRRFFDVSIVSREVDRGSNLVDASADEQRLCKVGSGEPYAAPACLPLMSEGAKHLYDQFSFHLEDVCARLTEERMMLQKEEIAQMLVYASSAASHQMERVAEGVSSAVAKMQLQSAMLDEQSAMMKEQREEVERMYVARRKEEQESVAAMREHTAQLLEEHSSALWAQRLESDRLHREREAVAATAIDWMANRTASILNEQAEVLRVRQSEVEAVLLSQRKETAREVERMKAEQAALIVEQADRIKEQKRDLERMQEMISSANTQMQPLSSIESYVRLATGSFTLLKALLNFFVSMNVAWMITAMPLLSRARRYLFVLFAMDLLAEVAVVWFADTPLLVEMGGTDVIEILRLGARAFAATILALSFLSCCFSPPKKEASSITMDELLESQMELVAKLNSAPAPAPASAQMLAEAPRQHTSSEVKASEVRGRSREGRGRQERLASLESLQPRRRRSRSPYRSSLTGLAMPLVTPVKPRTKHSGIATADAPVSHMDYQSTYYVHRSDALARQEEEAIRMELECARAMQRRVRNDAGSGSDDSWSSYGSSDESMVERPSAKRNKKRTVSELYASSGEESTFFSANEDSMSLSSAGSDALQLGTQERKKSKLAQTSMTMA